MTAFRFILACVILMAAAFIVALNWGYVIANTKNKKRGFDRRYSTVLIITLLLAALAALAYPQPESGWMLLIPLVDVGNWGLLRFITFRERT